jgi:hypothetical protein
MLPERTTTIGEGESAMTERPFHICASSISGQVAGGAACVAVLLLKTGAEKTHHESSREDQPEVHKLRGSLPGVC